VNLNEDQFNLSYETIDTGAAKLHHLITARTPDGAVAGRMQWSHRNIQKLDVEPEFSRRGLATQMWEHGHLLAETQRRVPQPKHSPDRTDAGDAWARSVGGRLPRRSRK
jgi:hypothetical protein